MTRIAHNGLGRIGKLALRDLIDTGAGGEIVLINDPEGTPDQHALLMEFDSVHGRWRTPVAHQPDALVLNGQRVRLCHEKTIDALPLADTVSSANTAIGTLNNNLASLQLILENQSTQQLPEQLNQTLQELQTTLNGLSPGSDAYQSLNSSLLQLNRTISNLETLTRTLADTPNAAVMPTKKAPDPVPEVNKE